MPIKFRQPQDINAIRFGATLVWGIINGVTTTVTGVSPLALVNALAKPIKKLIQYGKCTTVDDEIYCNNGKLVAIDDELPAGYKRLLGITFDGNIRYVTGEALTGDDDVTMTLNNISSSGKNLFGSYNGANDKNFSMYIYGSSSSGSYFRYGDQLKRPKYGGTGQRTITFGKSGTSGFADDSDVTPDEFTTPANTYIGMLPNSTSAAFSGDIVGSILVSNRLEWIPCERESDGVIGYYERFNGNFIAPTGSGTPVSLGYDASHMTVLSVVGTPEVLTVIGKNLLESSQLKDQSVWNTFKITVEPDTRYICSTNKPQNSLVLYFKNTNGDGGGSTYLVYDSHPVTVKSNENGEVWISQRRASGTASFADYEIMVEKGSTATEYEPYTSQTASVVNLFSDGTVHDEQDIISGTVTRRTAVSAEGGVITISALPSPVTEHVTPQSMRTVEGTNTVSVTSIVAPVQLEIDYYKDE